MTKKLRRIDNIRLIEADYKPDFDIFTEEKNITYQIKKIVFEDLNIIDRRIFLLYAEQGSLRKVGQILGVSTSKVFQLIKDIKKKIKSKLDEHDS